MMAIEDYTYQQLEKELKRRQRDVQRLLKARERHEQSIKDIDAELEADYGYKSGPGGKPVKRKRAKANYKFPVRRPQGPEVMPIATTVRRILADKFGDGEFDRLMAWQALRDANQMPDGSREYQMNTLSKMFNKTKCFRKIKRGCWQVKSITRKKKTKR